MDAFLVGSVFSWTSSFIHGRVCVFLDKCMFSCFLTSFFLFDLSLCISVCSPDDRLITHRYGRVQKNHKNLKKNTIFNEHPVIRFVPIDSSLYLKSLGCSHRELVGSLLQGYGSKARVIFLPVNLSICLSICLSVKISIFLYIFRSI